MRLLLDTHLLLWAAVFAAETKSRLSREALSLIRNERNVLHFSVASIWETAIKHRLGRPDFTVDARDLRRNLLTAGYVEVAISGEHAATVADLPLIHRDPFDRLLVAQAMVERLVLLTADAQVARYGGPVRRV